MTFDELKGKLQLSINRMTKLLEYPPTPKQEEFMGNFPKGYWKHSVQEELRILRQRLDLLEEWLKSNH